MWEFTANGEVDVDDHSKDDLDVSNLFRESSFNMTGAGDEDIETRSLKF